MKIFTNQFAAIATAGFLLFSCASSKTTSSITDDQDDRITIKMDDGQKDTNSVETGQNSNLQLVDYLRRVPGLQIDQRGSDVRIMIRGASSLTGTNSPLYVVNNSPIGNNYAEAVSAVDVNDIKTVNVIKGAEGQQMYGMRGANGVIQILTKKR